MRSQRRAWLLTSVFGVAACLAFAGNADGQDGTASPLGTGGAADPVAPSRVGIRGFTVESRGGFSLPVAGDAGGGWGAPTYADAFGPGFEGNVKIGYAVTPALGLRLDLGAVSYPASRFETWGTDNLFTDLNTAYALVSIDLTLRLTGDPRRWFDLDAPKGWTGPALGFSLGVGARYVDYVRWIRPQPTWNYWDSSVAEVFVARLAFRHRFTRILGLTVEADLRLAKGPPAATPSFAVADADPLLTFSLGAGLTVVF
jgi:hypothetical protein